MAAAPGPLLAAVLLLVSTGHHCFSLPPACPAPCTCQTANLLNCSSSGLSLVPQHIQDSVTELDLSHNLLDSAALDRPYRNLRAVWLGNNSITGLSLCIERNLGGRYARGRRLHRLTQWRGQGCVSWAPTLQLLSVERNQLKQLPEGLEGSESLQVLQLSFNRISTLRPEALSRLRQLKELHLQHNLIASLHPQMFQDLAQLQVLDLSFNMLTSLHPVMYLSLSNIGVDVRLEGNRWQCDCSMRSLRRRMVYDSSRGLQAWRVMCSSPSVLSGRDLLQLEESDLNCFSAKNRPERHQDVTVNRGSEILLSCSAQDSIWWTPSGQAPGNQPQAALLISDITERDTGLYVCVSEEHGVVSVFNLQISKMEGAKRKTRSLTRTSQQIISQDNPNWTSQERNQRTTQSDLILAVCLSIFVTFLVAFILGFLTRPCIEVLWRRCSNTRRPPKTDSVSTVQKNQYENEAYSSDDEPAEVYIHKERRVTFTTEDLRESSNVQYYDTVASGEQEGIDNGSVFEYQGVKTEKDIRTAGNSESENSSQQSSNEESRKYNRDVLYANVVGRPHRKSRSSSSSSDSSLSDEVFSEKQMTKTIHRTPKSPQLVEDSIQQQAHFSRQSKEVPKITIEGSAIPGFSSEPFADWSPNAKSPNLTDPDLWQQNEEQFEFSDSVRSMSPRSGGSVGGSFNDLRLTVGLGSDKKKRVDSSSSSSCVSENEITEHKANSDPKADLERKVTNAFLNQDASFQQQVRGADSNVTPVGFNQDDYRCEKQRHAVRPKHSISSHSSNSDEDSTVRKEKEKMKKVVPKPRTKWRAPSLGVTSQSSSSSNESGNLKDDAVKPQRPSEHVTPVKRRAPAPPTDPSSRSKSTDKTMHQKQILPTTRLRDGKKPSLTSKSPSSSESEDEITHKTVKQRQDIARLPFQESQAERRWPAVNLERTMRIKRRLDIKVASHDSDSSSSSDSEEETTGHIKKQRPGKVNMTGFPFQESQRKHDDPETQWPALNLEHSICVKRRLNVHVTLPDSDSSSSSGCKDETGPIKKQEHKETYVPRQPTKVPQTVSYDLQTQWPVVDLNRTTRVKRHLDIKVTSPDSDSSSSSDSEDETMTHVNKKEQWQMHVASRPTEVSPTVSHDLQTQWPMVDLNRTTRVKRHLDIKVTSPDSGSSSSSDSEDEITGHIKKQEHKETYVPRQPTKVPQTVSYDLQTQWPAVDLNHTARVKRHLDIKVSSPDSDSSSSSDSEDETTHYMEQQKQNQTFLPRQPTKFPQTVSYDLQTRWPTLNLEHSTRVKRRLNVKITSRHSDSSSSSDSEDETMNHANKKEQWQMHVASRPTEVSPTVSYELQTGWPALNLEHSTHVKRRLNVKVTSPDTDSSSSSDSEEETTGPIKKQEHKETYVPRQPTKVPQTVSYDLQTQWPVVDLNRTTRVKRHLDIKVTSPDSDSSSSSDSEDETMTHVNKKEQWQMHVASRPTEVSPTVSHDLQTQWPMVDLNRTSRVKRHLDIKVTSPHSGSSSSSDSEDEITGHIKKQEHKETYVPRQPTNVPQTVSYDLQTQWPAVDLNRTTRVKRHLDIKVSSPDSDSSSSSESDDEIIGHIKKQEHKETYVPIQPTKVPQTVSYDLQTQWPAVDLNHTTRVKRHLDIKVTSPDSDSSSSSDSEDETMNYVNKKEQWQMHVASRPTEISPTVSHDLSVSDSSSSTDSDNEKGHIEVQKQGKVILGLQESPAKLLDLQNPIRIKRRLDIKVPSPDGSSSSSDSEEDAPHHTKENKWQLAKDKVGVGNRSYQPRTELPDLDMSIPLTKRPLDRNTTFQRSESSSSDSDNEKGHKEVQKQGKVILGLPFQESPAKLLDLQNPIRIKRRLDIKAPSPDSHSSSSSDSEEDAPHHTKENKWQLAKDKVGVGNRSYQPRTELPDLDMSIPLTKRPLDRNTTFQRSESSSSDSDNERQLYSPSVKHERDKDDARMTSPEQQTMMQKLNLGTPRISRRLDIKAPTPQPEPLLNNLSPSLTRSSSSSSSSDSEDGKRESAEPRHEASAISKATENQFSVYPNTMMHSPRSPKTDDKFNLQKYTIITDDNRDKTRSDSINTAPEINTELESRWATMSLGISRFRKRLHNTSRSYELSKVSSSPPDSGTGSKHSSQKRRGVELQGIIPTESFLIPENKGQDDTSGSSGEISRKDYHLPKTEEWVNPDTTLNSTPQRYKGIQVSEKSPATPPSQSDSSSSSESEDAESVDKGWRRRSQSPVVTEIKAFSTHSFLNRAQTGIKLDQIQSQTGGAWPQMNFTKIPRVKRALVIRAPSKREPSSDSNTEDDTVDHSIPNLSLGIPRIKRHLNVKAPAPSDSTSSSSESENEMNRYSVEQSRNQSDMEGIAYNDPLITYKRSIFEASSALRNESSSPIDHVKQRYTEAGMIHASQAPTRFPSMNSDDAVKKGLKQSTSTTDVDLPSEIRWTGTGRQLSDFSISSLRRHQDKDLLSPQQELSAKSDLISFDSSSSASSESDNEMKQDGGEMDGTLLHIYSTPSTNNVSLASSRTLNKFDTAPVGTYGDLMAVSENKRERKGLSALKAMSSERQRWDTEEKNVDWDDSPLVDDRVPQLNSRVSNLSFKEDTKPLAEKPHAQPDFSAAPVARIRAQDLLYGLPQYRRQNVGEMGPPLDVPPPIPTTPLPDEAEMLMWRSPQSRYTGESNPSFISQDHIDPPNNNISFV